MAHHDLEQELIGRTYGDFLFRPQKGSVSSRKAIPLSCQLTRKLELGLPVVGANMDSVTDWRMAHTLALEGGIGIIHRGMSIERQANQVRRVKRSHGFIVENPLCLPPGATIREARRFIRRHNITGILIERESGSRKLAGMLSNRDLPWLEGSDDAPVSDFMTPVERLVTAGTDTSIRKAEDLLFKHRIEKLPLVDDSGIIRGLITKKDLLLAHSRPFSSKDRKGRPLVGAAIGARGDFLERSDALVEAGVDCLVVDIAHGHSSVMQRAVESFRPKFPDVQLICGNVGTARGAAFLKELGADAVKVGIGPGRGCRTRLETAAGVPQLQAIREAWCALGDSIPIIADGGIVDDKDIFLALMAGASTVMLGSVLAGTDESPGRIIVDPASQEKLKIYRGMTSPQAVLEGLYEADDDEANEALETPPEGQEVQIPYKGSVVTILQRVAGHLRSSISYAGEESLAAARAKIVPNVTDYLIPLSAAAARESYHR